MATHIKRFLTFLKAVCDLYQHPLTVDINDSVTTRFYEGVAEIVHARNPSTAPDWQCVYSDVDRLRTMWDVFVSPGSEDSTPYHKLSQLIMEQLEDQIEAMGQEPFKIPSPPPFSSYPPRMPPRMPDLPLFYHTTASPVDVESVTGIVEESPATQETTATQADQEDSPATEADQEEAEEPPATEADQEEPPATEAVQEEPPATEADQEETTATEADQEETTATEESEGSGTSANGQLSPTATEADQEETTATEEPPATEADHEEPPATEESEGSGTSANGQLSPEEEQGMEVEQITIKGKTYWIDTATHKLYAIVGEDDVGDEVGAVVAGKAVFL